MSTYTKTMSKQEIDKLKDKLFDYEERKTPPYAFYQIKTSECIITAYKSGKVVFQGSGADFYNESIQSDTKKQHYPQCGSDEVGTGDYFGPVVVCATCIEEKHLSLLNSYHIQDSKQLKDEDIRKIAPVLKEHLTYSLLILENEKYNQVHKSNNMNAIKAKLHNQAFVHLEKKLTFPLSNIIVDQFTPEASYYHYIKEAPKIIKNIHFETKAENKYLSVACASIIARYTFLEAMDQLNMKYNFPFPKGAGNSVDEAGKKFIKLYNKEKLGKVAKLHFKNTNKILSES